MGRVRPDEVLDGAAIVVIGGSPDDRRVLRRWLERAGASIDEAPDGATGLDLARGQPDLVITDVAPPDMDGSTLTAALKADPLTQQIPVIQHSAVPIDDRARAGGLTSGADAVLVAPFSEEMLLATAASLVRYRDLARQLEIALSLDVTGVFDWAIPTRTVRWSESLERIHRMPPGAFRGGFDDFVATIHPGDRAGVEAELTEALATASTIDVRFRFLRADGTHGWMEGRGRIFRDRSGAPVRLLGLAHDVTDQVVERQQIEQLRRLASELNAARTSGRVLDVLARELADSDIGVSLVDDDEPPPPGRMFSVTIGDRRLDVVADPTAPITVTTEQAAAIRDLAAGAIDRTLRFEVERSNAVALQRALLPRSTPDVVGWSVDAEYLPATSEDRLGGDFYDVVQLDGCFVVVLGDVAGHGLDADAADGHDPGTAEDARRAARRRAGDGVAERQEPLRRRLRRRVAVRHRDRRALRSRHRSGADRVRRSPVAGCPARRFGPDARPSGRAAARHRGAGRGSDQHGRARGRRLDRLLHRRRVREQDTAARRGGRRRGRGHAGGDHRYPVDRGGRGDARPQHR